MFRIVSGVNLTRWSLSMSYGAGHRMNFSKNLGESVGDGEKNQFVTVLEDDDEDRFGFQLSSKATSPHSIECYKRTDKSPFIFNMIGLQRYLQIKEGSTSAKKIHFTVENDLIIVSKEALVTAMQKDKPLENMLAKKKEELNKGRALKAVRGGRK